MPDHTLKDTQPETLRHFLVTRRQELQKQIDLLLAQHRDNHSDFRENAVLDLEDMSLRDSTGAQQIALLESRTKQRNQLDEALRRLEEEDPDVASVVRLRFYAGLSGDEAAAALGVSPSTVAGCPATTTTTPPRIAMTRKPPR